MWQAVSLAVCSWGLTLTLHYYYTCAGLMLWLRVKWRSTCNDCGCTLAFCNVYLREAVHMVSEGCVVHQSRLSVIVEDNPVLCLTLWLMMMHHHIKFSYERSSNSYFLDKAWTVRQSHRQIHGHCESNVTPTPPQFSYGWGGGGGRIRQEKQSRSTTLLLG